MKLATPSPIQLHSAQPPCAPADIIEYFGVVNYATSERVLGELKARAAAGRPATLIVTSAGGPSGTAMSFYDTVRGVLRANISTIGAGDVDSSGLVVFLAGTRRWVTPHTTALLHPAGRIFDSGTRYSAQELAAMAAEDALKDAQYASIVAAHSRLRQAQVLELMRAHTVLSAQDFVRYGLAEGVIQ